MIRKKIFKAKQYNKNKNYIFFFIFLIIFFFVLYYFFLNNNKYYIIPLNKDPFYYFPKEKGGQKIINQDKKGLHLNYKSSKVTKFMNDTFLNFSIQIMTSDDFIIIKNKRDKLLNIKDSIFSKNDLYLAIFKNNIGDDYLLLYKNFINRELALDYCKKYVFFLDKCIIVNAQQLD